MTTQGSPGGSGGPGQAAGVRVERRDFLSDGVRCQGWLYLPATAEPAPVLVLGHGYSVTHAFHCWRRCRAYANAGFAVFDFDPRHLGESDGQPRQVVSDTRQLADLRAALKHVRALPQVDGTRVAIVGTSLGGGLAVDVAASDPGIAAVVAVVPHFDGSKNMPGQSAAYKRRFVRRALADRMGRMLGRAPVLLPVVGPPGDPDAVLDRDEAWDLPLVAAPPDAQVPPDRSGFVSASEGSWRNQAAVWEALQAAFYRPGRKLKNVACPVLVHLGERDTVTPPQSIRPYLRGVADLELNVGDFHHFDPFHRLAEESVRVDIDFLTRHLLRPAAGPDAG